MSHRKESIHEAIRDVEAGLMFLPALQRRFEWSKAQIELLFDSIMRGYPIGTFLFWKLTRATANEYVFYEFKKSYDSRDPFNKKKEGAFIPDYITGVLDGQQRLSSIFIGLQGSFTEKGYRKREASPDAFKKTHLYLNLLSLPYRTDNSGCLVQDETLNFEFRFLTEAAVIGHSSRRIQPENDNEEFVSWFKIGNIMQWPSDPEIDHYIDMIVNSCSNRDQARAVENARRVIRTGLNTLYKRIHENDLINYFEISKEDLEDILKIFVRVNSGGTILSKTDLLFSTIVATWDSGREEIEETQKSINSKGLGFGFGTEYLMRCCLVLSDYPVLYKVHSFKSENVQAIRDNWRAISEAISSTVDLLTEFGYSKETLKSNNVTIPIAYYIYKGGVLDENSKEGFRLYLVHALLKRLFGSSQDQLLTRLRAILRADKKEADGRYILKKEFRSFCFNNLAEK